MSLSEKEKEYFKKWRLKRKEIDKEKNRKRALDYYYSKKQDRKGM